MTLPGELDLWPNTPDTLARLQHELAAMSPQLWNLGGGVHAVAGCWICHAKGRAGQGEAGDPCWAAAALVVEACLRAVETVSGIAPAGYQSGVLALREGPLLEAAVRRLPERPDVLLVNATGLDHPRRAGLAIHLGAKLSLPTVGVTRRPLLAEGPWPSDERGALSILQIGGEVACCWLRTRRSALPLVVHPAWRTDLDTAVEVVMATTGRWRTPEPLRHARRAAREARAGGGSAQDKTA